MAIKIINPFVDIPLAVIPTTDQSGNATSLSNLQAVNIGDGGLNVFRADKSGIWLGSNKFATAPFKVDMSGNVTASSIILTGYVATGGAAADVNANLTTISGGKITALSITSAQIAANTITSGQLSTSLLYAGTITLDTNGQIKGGMTGYDSGSGFFLGMSGGIYKFAVGNSAGNKMTWDGTTLSITGSLVGGDIAIGSGNNIFKADSNGIYLGNATFGSAPFRVSMAGAVTASSLTLTNASIGSGSSYAGNAIADTYIGNLTAAKITSGTITIGGTSQPSNLIIVESSAGSAGSTTSLLRWESTGGTLRGKHWTDSSGYMGYNAIGGRHYFYTANNENVVFQDGVQAIFNTGISCRGTFNVGVPSSTVYDARITGLLYLNPTTNTDAQLNGGSTTWDGTGYTNSISYNASQAHAFFVAGGAAFRVTAAGATTTGYFYNKGTNYMEFKDYTLTLTGDKTAVLPTSRGFNALYCMESPELWFMDFCKNKSKIDPLFKEVTVAPYHFIKCENGGYQIWGKRKGHEHKRFENKTLREFKANERFLSMNKI